MHDRDIIGPPRRKIAPEPQQKRVLFGADDISRFKRAPESDQASPQKPVISSQDDMFIPVPPQLPEVKQELKQEVPNKVVAKSKVAYQEPKPLPLNRILGIELEYAEKTSILATLQAKVAGINISKLKGPAGVAVLAIAILGVGIFASPHASLTKKSLNGSKASTAGSLSGSSNTKTSGEAVSEQQPTKTTIDSYQTKADQPKFLRIPIQGLKARVIPHEKLEAPDNIYDTAWFSKSAKLTDKSTDKAVVISGYAHGKKGIGAYGALEKLLPNDAIMITDGNDKRYDYKVVKVESYSPDKLDMTKIMAPINAGKAGLNLVSAIYPGDIRTQEITVVYATPF